MSKLDDKQTRLLMVERYLNAETSTLEERQLADYFSTATEPLTEEEESAWLILQATTNAGSTPFELSHSKVAEFDRLMRKDVPARHRRLAIAGWISAVAAAASIAILVVLFANRSGNNREQPGEQMATTQPEGIVDRVENECPRTPSPVTATNPYPTDNIAENRAERQQASALAGTQRPKRAKEKPTPSSTAKPDDVTAARAVSASHHKLNDIMAAANVTGEQVETYHIQPAGDAAIVTKTFVDGTSSSCIVCAMDDGSGYSVIPL